MYNEWRCQRNVLRQRFVFRLSVFCISIFAFLFLSLSIAHRFSTSSSSVSATSFFFAVVVVVIFCRVAARAVHLDLLSAYSTRFDGPRKKNMLSAEKSLFYTDERTRTKQDTFNESGKNHSLFIYLKCVVCVRCVCVFSFVFSVFLFSLLSSIHLFNLTRDRLSWNWNEKVFLDCKRDDRRDELRQLHGQIHEK